MHGIALTSNLDIVNLSSIVQLRNIKNKFIVGTEIGNIKIIEVERVINDTRAGNIKADKWSKNAMGMLATLKKDTLYDCVTEMQISFGPKRKITIEELNEQLLKMSPYDMLIPEHGLSCLYINISVLDINSSGILLTNKTDSSIMLVDLSKKKILASAEFDCDQIVKSSFFVSNQNFVAALTSAEELVFYEYKNSELNIMKRLYGVVNYSLSVKEAKDMVLIFYRDNVLEYHEIN